MLEKSSSLLTLHVHHQTFDSVFDQKFLIINGVKRKKGEFGSRTMHELFSLRV